MGKLTGKLVHLFSGSGSTEGFCVGKRANDMVLSRVVFFLSAYGRNSHPLATCAKGSSNLGSYDSDEIKILCVRIDLARHRWPTAHARARYRCFLPDLAGLAGVHRAGPMSDRNYSSIQFPSTPGFAETDGLDK